LEKIQPIAPLERCFTNLMLLGMVKYTKANHPSIGRLQPDPAIGPNPDVSTFDRQLSATRHAAVVPTNPCPMSRTGARIELLAGKIDPLGE
jgi:hypothetical protein